ncbi:hypothetical protein S40293_01621 [Stachybotrys chartarum IBT 40293]|nr:hypothetical protein S40293_01621 [Stachybotrys chartarum IBT 40293]
MSVSSFLYSQLFVTPKLPNHDFTGQTVVVTGANRGIGLEAARYLLRLNAACVVLAARSLEKGKSAAADLEASTGRKGAVVVHELDMEDHKSVESFASKMRTLPRIDGVILNAGIYSDVFEIRDGHERNMTVNVINTFLLALLLVPVLEESAQKWPIVPRITVVASDRHVMVTLPEANTPNTFDTLNDKAKTNMSERYYTSKLLQILLSRAMAEAMSKRYNIIINSLTPGFCISGLLNDAVGIQAAAYSLLAKVIARTTEVGGRTLVAGISQGKDSHGKYLNDGEIDEGALSPFVRSARGGEAQQKVWEELLAILEGSHPGIRKIVE